MCGCRFFQSVGLHRDAGSACAASVLPTAQCVGSGTGLEKAANNRNSSIALPSAISLGI